MSVLPVIDGVIEYNEHFNAVFLLSHYLSFQSSRSFPFSVICSKHHVLTSNYFRFPFVK